LKRAIFLDRDGVINERAPEGDYIRSWGEFRIVPGAIEGVSLFKKANFSVIVITNQRCVAKGLLAEAVLEEIHKNMLAAFSAAGAKIDDVYYCPHDLEPQCACRKPAPGMLLDAARAHGIDLSASWMIGDSDIDIAAGKNAGCKTARLIERVPSSPARKPQDRDAVQADVTAETLLGAAQKIVQREGMLIGTFTSEFSSI
jgi:D-glycero-D-manno-heptose 1,7-bisphosphate phosphatase